MRWLSARRGNLWNSIYAPINRWTESDALDPMFEKPQKAQVVRIKIEAVSLDSTSMAPSLNGPLPAVLGPSRPETIQHGPPDEIVVEPGHSTLMFCSRTTFDQRSISSRISLA